MKETMNWIVTTVIMAMIIMSVSSCFTPREGMVMRGTTGSAYNKSGGAMRERVKIPAPWK